MADTGVMVADTGSKDFPWMTFLGIAAVAALVIYTAKQSATLPTPAPSPLPIPTPGFHAPPFSLALSPSRATPAPQGPLTIQNTETLTAPFAQNFVPDTTETVSRF